MNHTLRSFFLWALFCTAVLAANTDSKLGQEKIVAELYQVKGLKKLYERDLKDMADEILASGFTYNEIEARFIRYLNRPNVLPFEALRKAIRTQNLQRFRLYYQSQVGEDSAFVQQINAEKLTKSERDKVIKAYSNCVYPLQFEIGRSFLSPIIGQPIKNYLEPRYQQSSIKVRTMQSKRENAYTNSYRLLMSEARELADLHAFNDFERLKMAKCIAEHALGFFQPTHHPVKALGKTMLLESRSPEMAFFGSDGVCSNFSAITYNIAGDLGLLSRLYLARYNFHVYLELNTNNCWYHCHPFNSASSCDLIEFGQELNPNGASKHTIEPAGENAAT